MAKKDSKLSTEILESFLRTAPVTTTFQGMTVKIRPVISLVEMLAFVAEVVSTCVDASEGLYLPEYRSYLIKRNVLIRYANFQLPESIEKQYDLIFGTGIAEFIVEHISQIQYKNILTAINNKINYQLSLMTSMGTQAILALSAKIEDVADQSRVLLSNTDKANLSASLETLKRLNEGSLSELSTSSTANVSN